MSVLDFEGLYCNLNYNQFNCREKTGKRSLCANVRLVQRLLFLLDRYLKHHRKNAYIYIDPKIANVQQFFSNFFEKIFAWENTQLILGIE